MLSFDRPILQAAATIAPIAQAERLSRTRWIEQNLTVGGGEVSYEHRPWWSLPINLPYIEWQKKDHYRRKSLICAGRQVEKCVFVEEKVVLLDGSTRRAREVQVGDKMASWDFTRRRFAVGDVLWKSHTFLRPCVRVVTEKKREMVIAYTHPVRTLTYWTIAVDLRPGIQLLCCKDGQKFEDRVVSIESVGDLPCVDFEVSPHHNYLVGIGGGILTHNSTSLGNTLLSEVVPKPNTNILYVAPTQAQVSEFSQYRIDAVLENSPRVAGTQHPESWSVRRKVLINGSRINLRWVFLHADRTRGLPADVLLVDEFQDIMVDNVPVMQECLTHSEWEDGPIQCMLGTPKTYDNAIEHYWNLHSTQNEWMTRCGCGFWNLLGEGNVGPEGLICVRCSRPINPRGEVAADGTITGAQWVRNGRSNVEYEGFRIPQLLLPYSYVHRPKLFARKWQDILDKKKSYPVFRFFNEVLGISYDSGQRPITIEDLRAACTNEVEKFPDYLDPYVEPEPRLVNGHVYIGVDWGTGDPSMTVLSASRYTPDGVFEVFYLKRFEGPEAEEKYMLKSVLYLCEKLRNRFIGVDHGFGYALNPRVREANGFDKVIAYSHAHAQREKLKYDQNAHVYTTNRTSVLSDVFTSVKRGVIKFRCSFEHLREIGCVGDFLSVYSEETRFGLKFDHKQNQTDDCLHSICYSFLVSQIDYPRTDLS